jgi:hypothetical protein
VDDTGVVDGFDLDGVNSPAGDASTCGHADLVDPTGRQGIDNQMAVLWPVIEPLVGEAVKDLLQGAINEGTFLLTIEVVGDLGDMKNASGLTVNLFSSSLVPDVGTFGVIVPDQTYYFDYEQPAWSVPEVELIDGEIVAGPVGFEVPIQILDADFLLTIHGGMVRFKVNPDGTFSDGVLGGGFNVQDVLGELYNTNARAEAKLVTPIFVDNADMGMVDGECTLFSVGFGFEGTTAFVVRDRDQE